MTASPANNQIPRDLKQNLTLRFSSLLFLFLALSGGTYLAVSFAVSAKEYDSVVTNLAGRQRMLIQKYTCEINQVLFGLAVADLDLAVEMKEAASKTAARKEEVLAALCAGGEVDGGEDGRIWIPPVQGADVVGHLEHVKTEWKNLRKAAIQAMRSDDVLLAKNEYVRAINRHSIKAIVEMEHVVLLIQKQSEARLRRVSAYMICASVLSAILFLAVVVFVRTKIVVPLDRSMAALEAEIAERKWAEEALRSAHDQTEQLLASINMVLIGIDDQDRVMLWNNAAEQVLGIGREDVLESPLSECRVEWNAANISEVISECRTSHRPTMLAMNGLMGDLGSWG